MSFGKYLQKEKVYMNTELERELRESLYIHRPLPLHRERSLEAGFPRKKGLADRILYAEESSFVTPEAGGTASLSEEAGVLTVTAPLRAERWPEGAASGGDYANYGTARLDLRFAPQDWRGFHRLRFSVRPQIEGARIAHLNAAVENRGESPLPDRYWREGATVFDPEVGVWNECIWEFAAMPRDAVCDLILYVFCSGGDAGEAEELRYDFRDIRLEAVERPEHEHGWAAPAGQILLSSAGYFPEGRKTALTTSPVTGFRLLDAERGACVFSAPAAAIENERGRFWELDFSAFSRPGRYVLEAEGLRSCVFPIERELACESVWKMINFLLRALRLPGPRAASGLSSGHAGRAQGREAQLRRRLARRGRRFAAGGADRRDRAGPLRGGRAL